MEMQHVGLVFGLTRFAGLATGIGSALAFFAKRTNTRFLSLSLGFSAGVMLYVSFVEIFVKAQVVLTAVVGQVRRTWYTVMAFLPASFSLPLSTNWRRLSRIPTRCTMWKNYRKMPLLTIRTANSCAW
jgi:ZIP family zinc transporter